ncbi:MAG: tetratricopeptide repeat protein [Anaerolineales bacterium]|nr:tetratricopeptide repeat protein [Anaerolineales bacterium]
MFLATAALAVETAPAREAALARFALFLGAAGLYYAAANTPSRAKGAPASIMTAVALLLWVYFATQHVWTVYAAKSSIIGQLGLLLNRWAPDLGLPKLRHNEVASLLAVSLPLAAVPLARAWTGARRKPPAGQWFWAAGFGLAALGLALAESLSSALAAAAAAATAGWWWLAGRLATRTGQDRPRLFAIGLGLAIATGGLMLMLAPGRAAAVLGTLPGLTGAQGRAAVFAQVWRLARDTPFTGAGLAAFPGYYSTYVLGIPSLMLTQAHNAYLNVLLEQGWPGLLSYLAVLAAGWAAAARQWQAADPEQRLWALAGGLGLTVVILQGLGDGTLVASWAALALLVPAGLAAGPEAQRRRNPLRGRGGLVAAGLALAGLAAAGGLTWRGWLAAWHADWGTVGFARVQLADWPTGQWSTGEEAPELEATRGAFERALALDPDNVTAHYRLGLLAELERDFATAARHLEQAHAADPGHRGIRKALAYAYVWLGETPAALPLLATLPETAGELSVYAWWWRTQGRADLARRAETTLTAVSRAVSSP